MPPEGCWIGQIEPVFGPTERAAVAEYMHSDGWLTEHTKTAEFESLLAEYLGVKHCIAMCNGTAALFASLVALGIGPGDKVIVPDYTFIATATAVSWTGATPTFVDISQENLCLNLDAVEQAALAREAKAIMAVNLNGRAADMARLRRIAFDYGLHLIEDAAQSLGSRYGGKLLGTFGTIGCLSFSAYKILTTGQGGMVVTDNDQVAQRVRRLKNWGRPRPGANTHVEIGYNFKFTDLQAVVGIEQFKKLSGRTSYKKEMFAKYRDGLAVVKEVEFVPTNLDDTTPWMVDVLVPKRDELRAFLLRRGIHTRPMYPAIHTQPAYVIPAKHDYYFLNSVYVAEHGLWLPSSLNVRAHDIVKICDAIKEFYWWK